MLHIQKGERANLPRKYWPVNNLCAIIYDQLTEILTEVNYSQLQKMNVSIDMKDKILVEDLQKGEIHALEWLAKNNLNEELKSVLIKHIVLSVLSDFLNFMYESLSCAKRGKMSVAYALLRKPLTDELLLFEQILNDEDDFIKRFYHQGEPINYDPSNRTLDKKSIVETACSRIKPKLFFNSDLIYDLRYNKASNGINGISNHALHIVTTDKNYKTTNKNLNFVFSINKDYQQYFHHYYFFVPYLLTYAVAIVDEILFKYLPESFQDIKSLKAFKRLVGLLLWAERSKTQIKRTNNALIKKLKEILHFECTGCKHITELKRADYELFFETEILICEKCYLPLLTSRESLKQIHEIWKILQ